MDSLLILGGRPLEGSVEISGAKNAALPILAATLLSTDKVTLTNVPMLQDIKTIIEVLRHLGVMVNINDDKSYVVVADKVNQFEAPYKLVKTMRASILVLGPLLARFGRAKVSLPGGCAIGSRPVDLHIEALKKMGAKIKLENGYIDATVDGRLKGADITFSKVTVGGTENTLMAAALAEGETILRNAAQEPEIVDLACFLRKLGADIEGEGTSTIRIRGVDCLKGCEHEVLPDRIETGTYLVAGAMTRGTITLNKTRPETLSTVIDLLRKTGAEINIDKDTIHLDMNGKRPHAVSFSTAPYPGFPTDMQAQFMALNCVAEGDSVIKETVFENRLMHAAELSRLGAQLKKQNAKTVKVRGLSSLNAATVMATDLRAGACLILAGLASEGGLSQVLRVYHVDRGYEHIEEKLQQLGAKIRRASEPSEEDKKAIYLSFTQVDEVKGAALD